MKSQHYKVTIFGDHYSLVSDESQEHMVAAAQLVDSLMKEVADKAMHTEDKKVAVLIALQLASKLLRVESLMAKDQEKQRQLLEYVNREIARYV